MQVVSNSNAGKSKAVVHVGLRIRSVMKPQHANTIKRKAGTHES